MKNIIILALFFAIHINSLKAQLSNGAYAPNFSLTDLNGNTHDLYTYLSSGKTVFLEVSQTWCTPCEEFATSGVYDTLFAQHGPVGMSGVNTTTTNDVMVLFIDNESSCLLHGGCGSPSGVDYTSIVKFPICNGYPTEIANFWTDYNIGYYPTVYMICPDRLVYTFPAYSDASYAEYYYHLSRLACPCYPPSSETDALALKIAPQNSYFCSANPQFRFQNYSVSNHITNATINIFSNSTLVDSFSWTGNLAPYEVANVSIPNFNDTSFIHYHFEVNVPGDVNPTNNSGADSIARLFSNQTAFSIPNNEDFESSNIHSHFTQMGDTIYQYFKLLAIENLINNDSIPVIGADGLPTTACFVDFSGIRWQALGGNNPGYEEATIGNYNVTGYTHFFLSFDYAYSTSLNDTTTIDTVSLQLSTDCGATWQTVWVNDNHITMPSSYYPIFTPTHNSDWKVYDLDISTFTSDNLILKLHAAYNPTENGAGCGWIDNIRISQLPLAVSSQYGQIKIVGMTFGDANSDQMIAAGADCCLPKHASVEVLDAALRNLA